MIYRATLNVQSLITDILKSQNVVFIHHEKARGTQYIRATFQKNVEPRRGDVINYGIAFKIQGKSRIEIGPYLYRIICENGAIISHDRFIKKLNIADFTNKFELTDKIYETIEETCSPIVYKYCEKFLMNALDNPGNLRLAFQRLTNFTNWEQRTIIFNHIVQRLDSTEQPTRNDLFNAITSLARDTRDAELKWNLEHLGWAAVIGLNSSWNSHRSTAELPEELINEPRL